MHEYWKAIVHEKYPLVDVSPEREIGGTRAIAERRTDLLRDAYAQSYKSRRPAQLPPKRRAVRP